MTPGKLYTVYYQSPGPYRTRVIVYRWKGLHRDNSGWFELPMYRPVMFVKKDNMNYWNVLCGKELLWIPIMEEIVFTEVKKIT